MKKVIIWILVAAVACVGVYFILPEYPKSVVTSVFQPLVNSQAKLRIDQVKGLQNKDLNASYKTILEGKVSTPTWVYQSQGTAEKVIFQGNEAKINIKDLPEHDDFLYTSCIVKFEFAISGSSVDITAYIDGKQQDDDIKKLMLQQLYLGEASLTN